VEGRAEESRVSRMDEVALGKSAQEIGLDGKRTLTEALVGG
jgi:hypothetical protein